MRNMVLCVVLVILCYGMAFGQTEKVLWSFTGYSNDGSWGPKSGLILDKTGNLYGTTEWGGNSDPGGTCGQSNGCGIAYELSPNVDGTWSETILYNFCSASSSCPDGFEPNSPLIFDESGNLYGTTPRGGLYGGGVVFELSPQQGHGGAWTETVLYNFCSDMVGQQCLDGDGPNGVIFDNSGNLFGTTAGGGSGHMPDGYYGGTAFELSPGSNGWTETVLYNFCSLGQGVICPDGSVPGPPIFDKLGNLYGLATPNLQKGYALVFKLSPNAGGWLETLAYRLSDGYEAKGALTFDPAGDLFGVFESGEDGAVFRLNSKTGYRQANLLGSYPMAGVIYSGLQHSLYGTTWFDAMGTNGTVFQIGTSGIPVTLYTFCQQSNCSDGQNPDTSLVEDASGNLYGATYEGGEHECPYGCGVVYEITPSQPRSTRDPLLHR